MDRSASIIPIKLKASSNLFGTSAENTDGTNWNLSERARDYLTALDAAPENLFFHALAVLHSPAYRTENSGALRQDWPRIPLPYNRAKDASPTALNSARTILNASAGLGREIASLLDTEIPVPGVTVAPVRDDLKSIARLTHSQQAAFQDGDLAVTAGWGNATKTGVMPGRGKIEEQPDGTLDIYLNDKVAWRGIPPAVWRYTIGGYQVMKKWLSYRERSVLGRNLTLAEATEVQHMARRIAALLHLAPALDANYEVVKGG